MRKILSAVVILLVCGSMFLVCDSGGGSDKCSNEFTTNSIQLNTTYNETIEMEGDNFYKFTITTSGDYDISLTNLTVDCGWELYDNKGTCSDNYSEDDFIDECDDDFDIGDEVKTVTLESGDYLLYVANFDNSGSYTLQVSLNQSLSLTQLFKNVSFE